MINKKRYSAEYRGKRYKAVTSRAHCGLNLITGGFDKPVMVTVLGIRPKGVLS